MRLPRLLYGLSSGVLGGGLPLALGWAGAPAGGAASAARTGTTTVTADDAVPLLAAGGSSTETDPLHPSSPYSAAKAAGDLLIPAYVRTFEVDASIKDDDAIAAKLEEVCPVDIFANDGGQVAVVEKNLDECVLCKLCIEAAPAGDAFRVLRRADRIRRRRAGVVGRAEPVLAPLPGVAVHVEVSQIVGP